MVSQQFTQRRSVRGVTSAVVLVVALTGTTLTGCRGPSSQQTMLSTAQLKGELLTPPLGAKPFSRGTLAPGGVLDLDQFVDGDFAVKDRPSEKESALQEGFTNATEVNWSAPDGTQVDAFLVQFTEPAGAADFVSGVSEATSEQEMPNQPLTALTGIPSGEGWAAGTVGTNGRIRQIAWLSVDNIAVDLHYYSPGHADPAGLNRLAKAQYTRLVGHVTASAPQPVSSAVAPPIEVTSATATAADKNRLLHDLVAPPKGSRPWANANSNGPTGILTLQQLLLRLATPAFRQQATSEEIDRGFQYAVRKNWYASDGTQADVNLLQFSTATGAQSFTLGYQGSVADTVGAGGTYPVPGSGDSRAFEHSGLTGDGNILTENYAVIGNIAVEIDFWVPAKADRAKATALFQQQFAALMADNTVARVDAGAPDLPTPSP